MMRYAYDTLYDVRTGNPWKVTIAYNRKPDVIEYAYTLCNPKDRFEKAVGRKLATEKLLDAPNAIGFYKFIEDKSHPVAGELNRTFTPQALEQMNFMHFKHNTVASILAEYVRAEISCTHRLSNYLY